MSTTRAAVVFRGKDYIDFLYWYGICALIFWIAIILYITKPFWIGRGREQQQRAVCKHCGIDCANTSACSRRLIDLTMAAMRITSPKKNRMIMQTTEL